MRKGIVIGMNLLFGCELLGYEKKSSYVYNKTIGKMKKFQMLHCTGH